MSYGRALVHSFLDEFYGRSVSVMELSSFYMEPVTIYLILILMYLSNAKIFLLWQIFLCRKDDSGDNKTEDFQYRV